MRLVPSAIQFIILSMLHHSGWDSRRGATTLSDWPYANAVMPTLSHMKIRISTAVLFCLVLLTTAIAAYKRGRNDVWIAEYKIYEGNLVQLTYVQTNQPLELGEFMKGRYYYLANKIPRSWLGSPYDFGPVNTNVTRLGVGKGPTTPQHEYAIFKEQKVNFREPKP